MRIQLLLIFFLAFGCKKSIPFDIEPGKLYSPTELTKQASVKCKEQAPWEGKMVRLIGRVSPFNGFDKPSAKFQLRDQDVFDNFTQGIEIYVVNASANETAEITRLVEKAGPRLMEVTGQAMSFPRPTQGSCYKGIHIEIRSIRDLSVQ